MWLWDSTYHSVAANHLSPQLGWDYLHSVLAAASADGAISIMRTPKTAGASVDETQPPLLTWAVVENWKAGVAAGESKATVLGRLAYALPRLAAYLRWDLKHRTDPTGLTPLLRWTRGTESGMDNSPRFDGMGNAGKNSSTVLLAVDFSVFVAREAALLATIATELGNATEAGAWEHIASSISASVHAELWDDNAQLYFDLNATATPPTLSKVEASTALLPLWLPDVPKQRVRGLVSALHDPRRFGTAVPIASVGRSQPSFSTDMWRGPMWVNSNYMVALALLARGARDEARDLMEATLGAMQEAYLRYGVIFEFYDADGTHDPRTLMRKGHPTGGVRDYHWSAALAFDMILRLQGSRW